MTELSLEPVGPRERITLLDVLRGFALFGVLYVNLHNFGSGEVSGPFHTAAKFFMQALFETKFFSLFSLLFGMGFAVQLQRAEARGQSLFAVYWRRLVVLFLIGWIHAAFYAGDILRTYALLGFLLFPFRRFSPRRLVLLAITIYAASFSSWYFFESGIFDATAETPPLVTSDSVQSTPGEYLSQSVDQVESPAEARSRIFRDGSIWQVIKANLGWTNRWFGILRSYGPNALALFLLGMAIVKVGIPQNPASHRKKLGRIVRWGFLIGLPAAMASAAVTSVPENADLPRFAQVLEPIFYGVAVPALALAYAAVISLKIHAERWRNALKPLAAVGRMALTVYVGQSLIYTTIFFGYGFGQFGQWGPAHLLPLAVGIFACEIVICNWWMKIFRFGPLEWIWRSLTYGKVQPFRDPN